MRYIKHASLLSSKTLLARWIVNVSTCRGVCSATSGVVFANCANVRHLMLYNHTCAVIHSSIPPYYPTTIMSVRMIRLWVCVPGAVCSCVKVLSPQWNLTRPPPDQLPVADTRGERKTAQFGPTTHQTPLAMCTHILPIISLESCCYLHVSAYMEPYMLTRLITWNKHALQTMRWLPA